MKNLATIKHLRSVMFQATSKYHQAVIEELKRLGKELEVVAEGWDEDEGEPKGCKVTSLGEDNESYEAIIDMIRYEESEPVIKVAIHVAWYNYKEINQWWGLSDLIGEAADYVIDSIVWPDEMVSDMRLNALEVIYEETKPDIRAVLFDNYNFKRRLLNKMTDLEKYIIWKEEDEVTCYTLDEFSAEFNDESISTHNLLYFIDFNACQRKMEQEDTKVTLYKVWTDSESAYDIDEDKQVIFNNLDEAHNAASNWVHYYDGEADRAIFHIDDMMTGETIDTVESIPGE